MKNILTIFKKELASYFNSPIAYIFTAVFLVIANWLFFQNFYIIGQANMRSYFILLPWMFLFLAPAITMRVWAEEKKAGTMELLLTLPVKDWEVVAAKFLSALGFLSFTLILSLTIPFTISRLGNLDWGPVIGGYIGAILMGGAYLSLGLFISSLTKNQIIAFLIGVVCCFAVFIIGADFVLQKMNGSITPLLQFLGIGSHFNTIGKGIIDSRDLIYYGSFIFIFLFLNVKSIESRNWR
ncbi:ABC transporter [Candidatus Falkowbacteria bacterium RBG_13_39_14]|uniref:ABC transporter n=1 Tax=Candidatus Falkowbacteria bacterium RBG_13_39_14 TaxID=1797985 RepID=A0A1F5S126_9BACT|nr:MAG: ABC transporter [Candidatus Falkowbacteria bacterium RBG_13_39_14]